MMRREFVWPPRGSTKDWIQCGTPRGQAGGGPSWGAPASHHLHTADRPVSLDMNSPPPPLLTSANPPPLFCAVTSLICIPVISYSHSSYLHLICPSTRLNSMWRQHCGLSCKCSFHSVTEQILGCRTGNHLFSTTTLQLSFCSLWSWHNSKMGIWIFLFKDIINLLFK